MDLLILVVIGVLAWEFSSLVKYIKTNGVKFIMSEETQANEGSFPPNTIPVEQRVYIPDYDRIQDVETVKEFLQEIGINMTLFGDQTVEDMGKDPSWWVEQEVEEVTEV